MRKLGSSWHSGCYTAHVCTLQVRTWHMCPWVEDEICLHQISGKDDSIEEVEEPTDSPPPGAVAVCTKKTFSSYFG